MRTPQTSPAVDGPDASAAGENHPFGPPLSPALLSELHRVQKRLAEGGVIAVKRARGHERADQLDTLASMLVSAAIMAAHTAGAERRGARDAEGGHDAV